MLNKQALLPLKLLLFSFHAANTIVLTFLPVYLQDKGLTGTEIGWVLAIGPLASIISQPFWGYLSDKYKTVKKMLIIAIIGMIIGSMIFFQMNQLVAILIFAAIFYFFSSPVGALSDSLAQRRANEMKISFGSIRMWGSIGFGVSVLIVGEILDRVGVQYLMWPYLVMGIVLLTVVFFTKDVKNDNKSINLLDVRNLLKNKDFILFLLVMMFITVTHRASDSYIGIYIIELGGTERLIGWAWFIAVMSEAVVFATAVYWFRKYNPLFFIIIAAVLYTIRWFIYGAATNPYHILAFQALHGVTFAVFFTAAFDYVTRIIPSFLQSTGHLIFYSVLFGVSGIIASMGGGVIIEKYGGQTLYQVMGVTTFIGIFFLIAYFIRIKRAEL